MSRLPLFADTPLPPSKNWILEYVDEKISSPPAEDKKLYLMFSEEGLSLRETGGALSPLFVDFVEGELRHKRKQGVGKSSLLGKALGAAKGNQIIFDATLGLGHDSWMFLCMGLQVLGCEKSDSVYALTRDALERAEDDEALSEWLDGRFEILHADAADILNTESLQDVDVIYFDFMFPEKKKALPRKSMQLLARLGLSDEEREKELVLKALSLEVPRVVVKRPLKAQAIVPNPSHTYEGNSVRYDVYVGVRTD